MNMFSEQQKEMLFNFYERMGVPFRYLTLSDELEEDVDEEENQENE